jgi:hypothetical protein
MVGRFGRYAGGAGCGLRARAAHRPSDGRKPPCHAPPVCRGGGGPALARGAPSLRSAKAASPWPVGTRVRTLLPARNTRVAGGHTRLPAYVAGKTGRILMQHGSHILPDSHAHGQGEAPEPLYTVVFDAADLWGQPERAGDEITADLWHSYLAPE